MRNNVRVKHINLLAKLKKRSILCCLNALIGTNSWHSH